MPCIGAGDDPVVQTAKVFDIEDGDAQYISKYENPESYDCVNSSHCLEHMIDVPRALKEWWSLVKVGGYMVITVPHEDLYEQEIWPSVFNGDHKATFRLNKQDTWSDVSYDIHELCGQLLNAQIVDECIHDHGYDYELQGKPFPEKLRKIWVKQYSSKMLKAMWGTIVYLFLYRKYYKDRHYQEGTPIDQTSGNSNNVLAQIQVVVKKTA